MSDSSRVPIARASSSSNASSSSPSPDNGGSSRTLPQNIVAASGQVRNEPVSSRPRSLSSSGHYKDLGNGEGNEDTVRRRHRPRHSGGFLLDATPTAAFGGGAKIHSIHGFGVSKGKGKDQETDLGLRRTRDRQSGHRAKPSIGSSPLSMEVTNAASQEDHGLDGTTSRRSQPTSDHGASNQRATRDGTQSDPVSFDSDPAQIVNLALNLSESRRRQASISRLSPMVDTLGANRRIASAGQLGPGFSLPPVNGSVGGSLRYHLQQQLKTSRNPSPRSDHFERPGTGSRMSQPTEAEDHVSRASVLPGFDLQLMDDPEFSPSDSTLLRAAKARTALELSYEHRRLLQYLPQLPLSDSSRPNTARGGTKLSQDCSPSLGRAYNPLQYVRNRKVRGRERKTFDAEAEGWKDLEKVRDWVNSVASQRMDYVSRADDKYPLPPFETAEAERRADDPSSASSPQRTNVPSIPKLPRPRSDWVTTAWDLLADAYWLELDAHKRLIEDHDGHKLYPFPRFQAEHIRRLSKDIPLLPARRSSSLPRASQSPERSKSTADTYDLASKPRGRGRHQLRDSITSVHEYSSSQDRKSGWHRKLMRSQSSSSSDESAQGSLNRQSRLHSHDDSRERQDSAVLERQVMELLAKEAESIDWGSVRASPDYNQLARTSMDGTRPAQESMDDLDVTAPSSPTDKGNVPTIAINQSRPSSQAPSTRKPLPSQHRPPNLEPDGTRKSIDEVDFASVSHHCRSRSRAEQTPAETDADVVKAASDGFLSPKSAKATSRVLRKRHSASKSLSGFKDHRDSESRLRGLLKGSRFADIVGSPVSRVGDLLWRKDGSNHPSNTQSPRSSYASEASETDEVPAGSTIATRVTRSTTDLSNPRDVHKRISNGPPPKFHINNLPSFRSPTRNSDLENRTPLGPHENDHITRQQRHLRERGRPTRFDRLAPPNLDMRSISPTPSRSLSRVSSRENDVSDDSRRPSATSSEFGTRWSDYTAILGTPGKLRQGDPPITGLANIDNKHRTSLIPDLAGERHWSISDQGAVPAAEGPVTKQDITRVRALLLSSGVKAHEIVRRANQVHETPTPLLLEVQRMTNSPPQRVPRSQEHVLAARLLVQYVDEKHSQLRQAADHFSHANVDSFHSQLKSLDNHISTNLTPLLRASADDADALDMELSTSHRLDVKRLNDSIDHIFRRKRRKFRWVRRGGYLLLEWMLLGAMWWVWLIVVLIRFTKGAFVGVWRIGRWLLCL